MSLSFIVNSTNNESMNEGDTLVRFFFLVSIGRTLGLKCRFGLNHDERMTKLERKRGLEWKTVMVDARNRMKCNAESILIGYYEYMIE